MKYKPSPISQNPQIPKQILATDGGSLRISIGCLSPPSVVPTRLTAEARGKNDHAGAGSLVFTHFRNSAFARTINVERDIDRAAISGLNRHSVRVIEQTSCELEGDHCSLLARILTT